MAKVQPKHPSPYSDELIPVFAELLTLHTPSRSRPRTILDPMAGIGKVHLLDEYGFETWSIELEPEWVAEHPRALQGNVFDLKFPSASFDAVVVSPTYANRFADHHNAKDGSVRVSYKHCLGREPHPENSGVIQWGDKYIEWHERAWVAVDDKVKPGGYFVLNSSDHIRDFQRVSVTQVHRNILQFLGYEKITERRVKTRRMRFGANSDLRVPYESVILYRKPNKRSR